MPNPKQKAMELMVTFDMEKDHALSCVEEVLKESVFDAEYWFNVRLELEKL